MQIIFSLQSLFKVFKEMPLLKNWLKQSALKNSAAHHSCWVISLFSSLMKKRLN